MDEIQQWTGPFIADLPLELDEWSPPTDGFGYASDMVEFVRQEFGDRFVIGVAGYPAGHPEAKSYEEDIQRLKQKVKNLITEHFSVHSKGSKVEEDREMN